MKKKNQKMERTLFAVAAIVFVLLVALLLWLLLASRGGEGPVNLGEGEEPQETASPDRVEIAGQLVDPETDTFYLHNAALTQTDLERIAGLRCVSTLSLTNCSLTDISFLRYMPGLTTVYLSGNAITDVSPLQSLMGLRTLYLDGNPVTDLSPLRGMSSLSTLSLKGVSVAGYILDDLRASMPGCNVFDDSAVGVARPLSLGGLDFTVEDTVLDLSGRGITDITRLTSCQKLLELNLAGNPLESIAPLTQLPVLSRINLASTGLEDGDLRILMGIRRLQWLNITGNSALSAEAVDAFKEALPLCQVVHDELFYKAELGGEEFTSDITILSLPLREIEDISDLEKFERLEIVDLSGNYIDDISALGASVGLREVNLQQNLLRDISVFYKLTAVTTLDLSDNLITDVTALANCTSLRWLDVSNNDLSYISHLALCPQLEWLDLRGNPQVTREAVDYLQAILPACQILTDLPEPTPSPTPEPTPTPTAEPTPVPPPVESPTPPEPNPEQTPVEGEGESIPVM